MILFLLNGRAHSIKPLQKLLQYPNFSCAHSLAGDAALFASTFFETFTTNSSDDRTVELIPGGAQRDVTYASRVQYCDLVLNVRI